MSVAILGVSGLSHAVRGAITPRSNLTLGLKLTQHMARCRKGGSASRELRQQPRTAATLTRFFHFVPSLYGRLGFV